MTVAQLSAQRTRKQRRNGSESIFRRRPNKNLFYSMLVGGLLWASVVFLYYVGGTVSHTDVVIGQRAQSTVVAAVGFGCTDLAGTELLKKQAAANVHPVFTIDMTGFNTSSRTLAKFYDRMALLREQEAGAGLSPDDFRAEVSDMVYLLGLALEPEDALALAPAEGSEEIAAAIHREMARVWESGIISERERDTLFDGLALLNAIAIQPEEGEIQSPLPLTDVLLPDEARKLATSSIRESIKDVELPKDALRRLLGQWLTSNLRYDAATSEEKRNNAEKGITPGEREVDARTTLVEAGQEIDEQIVELLNAHRQKLAAT